MSKRSFAEINTVLELIELSKSSKRPKLELTMLAKKRVFKKRKREASLSLKVNRILDKRIETKFAVKNVAQADINGTPMFQEATNIGQGNTETTRIGNQINPTYLEWKILFGTGVTTESIAPVRVMLVQSKTGPLVVGDMPSALLDAPDYDNYNIIQDRLIVPNYAGFTDAGTDEFLHWSGSKVLKRAVGIKQTVQYDSTTTTSDGGGIYLFAFGLTAAVDVIDGYITLKYKDG